jgi:hypothetical protein
MLIRVTPAWTVKLSGGPVKANVQVTVVVPVHDGTAFAVGVVAINPAAANASSPALLNIQRTCRIDFPRFAAARRGGTVAAKCGSCLQRQ